MKEYFFLQYKMTNRKLREAGINPLVGYVIGAAGFILTSEFIFFKTEFAKYLIAMLALSLLLKASEINRTEFLILVFGNKKYRLIRMIENLIICLPFSILLICHYAFLESLLLLTASQIIANFSIRTKFNYSLPTPFYKKPFEFIVGFRNTFYIFPIVYMLIYIAISVDNLNLGVLSMLVVFLVALTYYLKPENEYFVWSHSTKPGKFLVEKLITATKYSAFLALPIVFILVFFYPKEINFILLFLLIGFSFLWTIVLAKYSAYPNEINITDGILIAVCLPFPPLLVLLIPYFYSKAIKSLYTILK